MAGKTIGELTTLENPSSSAVIPISPDGSILNKTTIENIANIIIDTYSDGINWYKVYSNGWCEQGGYHSNVGHSSAYTATIALIKPMKDTSYYIFRTPNKGGIETDSATRWIVGVNANTRTTTSFQMFTDAEDHILGDFWEVKGYAF